LVEGCVEGDHPWVGRAYNQWHVVEPQHLGGTTWVIVANGQNVAEALATSGQNPESSLDIPVHVHVMSPSIAEEPAVVVVRPDGYVAAVSEHLSEISVIVSRITGRVK
jgi:hypothetical protein